MIKKLFYVYYWTKALNLIQKENYLDAFNYLTKIDENDMKDNIQFFILKGYSLLNLAEWEYGLRILEKAEYILTTKKIELNQDSMNYLLFYIYDLKDITFLAIKKDDESIFWKKKKNDLSFNISKVEKNINDFFL